jgi:titin
MLHFLNFITSDFTEVPGAPSQPQITDIQSNCLRLSWQPPSKDGGTPILGYHVEKRSGTARRWVFVNRDLITTTTFNFTELFEGMEYEFRVSAENKMGCGSPSEPSAPVVPKDPWGKILSYI